MQGQCQAIVTLSPPKSASYLPASTGCSPLEDLDGLDEFSHLQLIYHIASAYEH